MGGVFGGLYLVAEVAEGEVNMLGVDTSKLTGISTFPWPVAT